MGINVGISFRLTSTDHPHFLDSEVHSHSQNSQIRGQTLSLSNTYAQTINALCSHYLSTCLLLGLTYTGFCLSCSWSPDCGLLQFSQTLVSSRAVVPFVGGCLSLQMLVIAVHVLFLKQFNLEFASCSTHRLRLGSSVMQKNVQNIIQ